VSGEVVEAGARAEGEQQACERHAEVVLRRGRQPLRVQRKDVVEAPARAEEGRGCVVIVVRGEASLQVSGAATPWSWWWLRIERVAGGWSLELVGCAG